MSNCINTATLSGTIGWLAQKYSALDQLFLRFSIEQDDNVFADGKLVSKRNKSIYVSCFSASVWSGKGLKVGTKLTVEGYIDSFDKDFKTDVVVTKIHVQDNPK